MFYMTHTKFLISFGMTLVILGELNNQFVITSYKYGFNILLEHLINIGILVQFFC
jgi:hypothetical protein